MVRPERRVATFILTSQRSSLMQPLKSAGQTDATRVGPNAHGLGVGARQRPIVYID